MIYDPFKPAGTPSSIAVAGSPLAPLSATRQNTFGAKGKTNISSPFTDYNLKNRDSPAPQGSLEKFDGKENVSPTPAKRVFREMDRYDDEKGHDELDSNGCVDDEFTEIDSTDSTVRRTIIRGESTPHRDAPQSISRGRHGANDNSLPSNPPSSPFQYNSRNNTVDCQNLPLDQPSKSSPILVRAMSESPVKKRSKKAEPWIEIHVDSAGDNEHADESSFNTAEESIAIQQDAPRADNETNGFVMAETDENLVGSNEMSNFSYESESHEPLEMEHDDAFLDEDVSLPNDPMDETCLSTFSAVLNTDMTAFANLRCSTTHLVSPSHTAQHAARIATPKTVKCNLKAYEQSLASPTIGNQQDPIQGNDTTNLLDFTDHITYFTKISQGCSNYSRTSGIARQRSPGKSRRESIRTPGKYNLLDFDIPPAPTPRSVPTITPRELESMKSNFLSEISSLKATVSGKEAEVTSLKQAVADAERRVGEALEEVRNEAAKREALEAEQAEWERRGKEMDRVLQDVRAEIVDGERERESLAARFEEAEKRKEQFEGRVVELESQLEAARKAETSGPASCESSSTAMKTAEETAREVQGAVERVARELHVLYKGKHETKVAALKKSYEARWEKRVREVETRLRDATEEIERLKTERDTTMSGPINANASMIGLTRDNEELEAERKVLEAKIKGLQQEVASVRRDNERLHSELKIERTEKGELVAAVDEWLAMQQIQNQQRRLSELPPVSIPTTQCNDVKREAPPKAPQLEKKESLQTEPSKRSASRIGIKTPSSGVATDKKPSVSGSRLGMYGHSRMNSNGGGNPYRPASTLPTPGRSGIMSSIERMGRGGS